MTVPLIKTATVGTACVCDVCEVSLVKLTSYSLNERASRVIFVARPLAAGAVDQPLVFRFSTANNW